MGSEITYGENTFTLNENETVLDGLLRQGEKPEYSCKNGVCQACIMQGSGDIPAECQKGLNAGQVEQGLFLACKCLPQDSLNIVKSAKIYDCEIIETKYPSEDIVIHRVRRPASLEYKAGQFVSIHHKEESRPYSLASAPHEKFLEFHIRVIPGGALSPWLYSWPEPGNRLKLGEAQGNCSYSPCEEELILAGTGTGMAPLFGILKEALEAGHQSPIHIFHGGRTQADLYMHKQLIELAEKDERINYIPALTQEIAEGIGQGRLDGLIEEYFGDFANKKAYLCGNPGFVESASAKLAHKGIKQDDIFADAFTPHA